MNDHSLPVALPA